MAGQAGAPLTRSLAIRAIPLLSSKAWTDDPPAQAVTWIVTYPSEQLAIYCRLQRAMAIDAGSLAARKSLILIIFIISHRTRSIFRAASVNRRVAGSNPA